MYKQSYSVRVGDVKLHVESDEYGISIDGVRADHLQVTPGRHPLNFTVVSNGNSTPVTVESGDEDHEFVVYVKGEAVTVSVLTPHDQRILALRKTSVTTGSSRIIVTAPMPGLLKQMLVSEGDLVEKGRPLCILEAMKMENEIKAPARLVVKRLLAAAGSAVEKSTPLVELQAAES